MGYTTDFIGHINISPPLNDAEQMYLQAFAQSRRYDRAGGPYEVPENPAAERCEPYGNLDGYNDISPGQPSLWCGWTPCWDGCCLSHDGIEKFYNATRWMSYLIEHFLALDAHAAGSDLECFSDFSFDHHLNGVIAACRRDTRRLYHIRVLDNVVTEETIIPGDPNESDFPPLAYEVEIDKTAAERRRRRRTAGI